MSALTRSDLERAAADYFRRLAEEVDAPRGFDKDNLTAEVALNVEASRDRITDLDDQLSSNDFEGKVRWRADRMVEPLGVSFGDLDERQQLFALQLAARAEREQMQLLMHLLTTPARNFQASDDLFLPAPSSGAPTIATPERRDRSPLLTEVTEEYLARKVRARRGRSQITELTRAFGWLSEVAGPRATLASVTREMMREFRDDVQRLERLRGQKTSFKARLTNNPHDQIAHVTAKRYWGSIQSFFAWCVAERGLPSDPAAGLKLEKNRREVRRSPEAFTQEELQRLFATPLYAGHKSPDRVMQPGTCHRRRGHWWSGILLMHTGLRAGELSQLHPSDFYFDEEVPFLRVTDEGEHGAEKFVKNAASVRDVPLAPVLLTLGLREFVEARKKRKPNGRVFFEFRLTKSSSSFKPVPSTFVITSPTRSPASAPGDGSITSVTLKAAADFLPTFRASVVKWAPNHAAPGKKRVPGVALPPAVRSMPIMPLL